MTLRVTILGCGSSGGVPRIGGPDGRGNWGDCDPAEPKNRRLRCSILVERFAGAGLTRVLVDTGPDLREQMIANGVGALDGVIMTHAHADHIHGIDDLRAVVLARRARLSVWADAPTADVLTARFGYVFETPPGSEYPPILDLRAIEGPVTIEGAGGPVTALPFEVEHGRIPSLGLRFGPIAYLPDASAIPPAGWAALEGTDTWIVDALRRAPHPSHAHLERTLEWIERLGPRRAILTNMHVDLDYATLCAELPAGVEPAFDGMVVEAG